MWQRVLFRSNKLRVAEVCEAWDLTTEAIRSYDLRKTQTKEDWWSSSSGDSSFVWPFWELDNVQLLDLIKPREQRNDIDGVLDVLNNLRTGRTNIYLLLLKDDLFLSKMDIPGIISLGPEIPIKGGFVHQPTLLKMLHYPEEFRTQSYCVVPLEKSYWKTGGGYTISSRIFD